MPAAKLPRNVAQEALDAYCQNNGSATEAGRALGVPRPTMENRLEAARRYGLKPSPGIGDPKSVGHLQSKVRRLEQDLRAAEARSVETEEIKRIIGGMTLAADEYEPPIWTQRPSKHHASPGVPTLFLSDFHWGEVVKPSQIMNKNAYGLRIARERLRHVAQQAIHLLEIISPKMDYPGIVIPLGGDMISGNIHEELQATNEINTMPTVIDLYGELVTLIELMADTFGHVFLPCVTGNHGRDTHKIWTKDRHHTSFDWLLYRFLAKRFEKDRRVQFYIPDGPDALYKIYDHRFLLTHGDQFRGGDSMIGALGPLTRGGHKKLSRNAQVGLEFDTMLCGHWHQYIHLMRLIVNSSLKGYDEYAFNNNFPFEKPQQALWLNHPKYGITYRMPVFADPARNVQKTDWVAVAA